jgi:hypothetical protein
MERFIYPELSIIPAFFEESDHFIQNFHLTLMGEDDRTDELVEIFEMRGSVFYTDLIQDYLLYVMDNESSFGALGEALIEYDPEVVDDSTVVAVERADRIRDDWKGLKLFERSITYLMKVFNADYVGYQAGYAKKGEKAKDLELDDKGNRVLNKELIDYYLSIPHTTLLKKNVLVTSSDLVFDDHLDFNL